MIIDITQAAKIGVVTSKKGSPTLKVEKTKFNAEIGGEFKEDYMTVFSCGVHNTGTHIDTMGPVEIEPERFIALGIKFNVSHIIDRPIELKDLDVSLVEEGQYVFFQTGWDKYLGEDKYFDHPELSMEVLEYLVSKKVNMIGIDALGVGKGKNHPITDAFAAKHKAYIIENLTNLDKIPESGFKVYCFPSKVEAIDAIPARILVEA